MDDLEKDLEAFRKALKIVEGKKNIIKGEIKKDE